MKNSDLKFFISKTYTQKRAMENAKKINMLMFGFRKFKKIPAAKAV